uniref:Putative cytochrome n=1 Tax=Ixodes ricinus TaxID=34613 RepID=V5H8T9_IXORI
MAQCVLFFLAGQDTTSSVISFTLYLLAIHPEIQAKLREEVDDCFKKHGPEPSLDVISKLRYLHGVVSESLRMFPPATRLERSALNDYVLGDTGIKVPKGCMVVVPVYSMHHDPDNFPDPTTFDPERFSDENIDSIRPYTYLPFGAGPRNCIRTIEGYDYSGRSSYPSSTPFTAFNLFVPKTQRFPLTLSLGLGFSTPSTSQSA